MEEKYINRATLYTVYLADNLDIKLKKSNIVSILKGKNYKIVTRVSSKFTTYKYLSNLTSREIERCFDQIHKYGYIQEKLDPVNEIRYINITDKGLNKVAEFKDKIDIVMNISNDESHGIKELPNKQMEINELKMKKDNSSLP